MNHCNYAMDICAFELVRRLSRFEFHVAFATRIIVAYVFGPKKLCTYYIYLHSITWIFVTSRPKNLILMSEEIPRFVRSPIFKNTGCECANRRRGKKELVKQEESLFPLRVNQTRIVADSARYAESKRYKNRFINIYTLRSLRYPFDKKCDNAPSPCTVYVCTANYCCTNENEGGI